MSTATHNLPEPGQLVRVRTRRYLVEEVTPAPKGGDSTLVGMSCVDDDAQGQELKVLWEKELDAEVMNAEAWERLANGRFDDPNLFAAYLHALRWNCVTATDPKLFQAPFRAGIKIETYQLEPLRKALLLPRVNLFIADDVGTGKTVEAGLIARELLLRRKVREIAVICPPSMLAQWKDEMETRFGLVFEVVDRAFVARMRQERGFAVNPWTTHTRFLVSQRLLIDEDYAGPMRAWLGELRAGSLLILDEAHHAAPSGGSRYAIDSKITRTIRDLAPRFEHRLFLSATPHNGHSNSFSSLLEILDPQRFCRGVPVKGRKQLEAVMVRRLKDDLREIQGGFPKREVHQIDLDDAVAPATAPEIALSRLLNEYRDLRETEVKDATKRAKAAAGLLTIGLQQRLLSSIEAFSRTLKVHRRTVERLRRKGAAEAAPPPRPAPQAWLIEGIGPDDDLAALSEEDQAAEEEAQIEAATVDAAGAGAAGSGSLAERQDFLLNKMTEIAESNRARPDAKVLKLVEWIRSNMCPAAGFNRKRQGEAPGRWNDTRLIVFTEFTATRRYLQERLAEAIAGTELADQRIAAYDGPTPSEKRLELKRAFNADPKKHPIRILIATDAAREGLNLQLHCWNLVHFDVPWNPSRMEQRNGRIDRKLQPSPVVYCHYFHYKNRPEDRILQVLVQKTEIIRRELGSLAPVVEDKLTRTLKDGIRHRKVDELARELDEADADREKRATVAEELEEDRKRKDELRKELETLRNNLERSSERIAFKEDQFRGAVTQALTMLNAPALKPLRGQPDAKDPPRYVFPAIDKLQGVDPSWAASIDTLRPPRDRDQTLAQWRSKAPVRPVVFQDSGKMDEDVVHLHLEQRVVSRLMSRFLSQGFVYNDLARACLSQTRDAIPRIVLVGRLCLYGPEAVRLHEDLIFVTARWTDLRIRKGTLSPFAREAEAKTLSLLEESLAEFATQPVAETVRRQFKDSMPRDVQDLLPHLNKRGEEWALEAEAELGKRGTLESTQMRAILEDQRKRIAAAMSKQDSQVQQPFPFAAEEKKQRELDRRQWKKRLTEIDKEISTEPERIADQYRVRAKRVEPVGLVYLWPITG